MALIKALKVTLPPSSSDDVAGYRLRILASPATPNYDTPFIELGDSVVDVDVASLPGVSDLNGTYVMSFSSVDQEGNESDFVTVARPLDFLAPAPPGQPVFSS